MRINGSPTGLEKLRQTNRHQRDSANENLRWLWWQLVCAMGALRNLLSQRIRSCQICLQKPSEKLVGGWTTHLKNMLVKMVIFPNFRGENKKYLSCHHLENLIRNLNIQQTEAIGFQSVSPGCIDDVDKFEGSKNTQIHRCFKQMVFAMFHRHDRPQVKEQMNYKQTFVRNLILVVTLPKTSKSPLKISLPKRKFIFQPSIFRCKLLVSGRVIWTSIMGYSDSCRELVTIVYSWLVNLPPYKVPREK